MESDCATNDLPMFGQQATTSEDQRLALIALLVARAGQKDSLAWWDDESLTDAGRFALTKIFPRNPGRAAVRLAFESAKGRHAGVLVAAGITHATTLLDLAEPFIEELSSGSNPWSASVATPEEFRRQLLLLAPDAGTRTLPTPDLAGLLDLTACDAQTEVQKNNHTCRWLSARAEGEACVSLYTGVGNYCDIEAMKQEASCPYTTRLQKGGALLADMRILVRAWHNGSADAQRSHGILTNVLGKQSRARVADTYQRTFLPRFVHGAVPQAWRIARALEDRSLPVEVLRPVYYWITARSESLLYDFATDFLYTRVLRGECCVTISDAVRWIGERLAPFRRAWSPTVTLKVARGLLAALRDFGVLEGRTKKQIAPVHLPAEAFAYIAFAVHLEGLRRSA